MPGSRNDAKQKVIRAILGTGVPVHPKILKAVQKLGIYGDHEYFMRSDSDDEDEDMEPVVHVPHQPPTHNAPHHAHPPHPPKANKNAEREVLAWFKKINQMLQAVTLSTSPNDPNYKLGHFFTDLNRELATVKSIRREILQSRPDDLKNATLTLQDHQLAGPAWFHKIALQFHKLVKHRATTLGQHTPPLPDFKISKHLSHADSTYSVPLLRYLYWLRKVKRQSVNLLQIDLYYNYSRRGRPNEQARPLSENYEKLLHALITVKKVITRTRRHKRQGQQ